MVFWNTLSDNVQTNLGKININIWCFEINIYFITIYILLLININIWCFEIWRRNWILALQKWLISTYGVLKSPYHAYENRWKVRININIWCFEMHSIMCNITSILWININIWCFEIMSVKRDIPYFYRLISTYGVLKLIPSHFIVIQSMININIWCFEI